VDATGKQCYKKDVGAVPATGQAAVTALSESQTKKSACVRSAPFRAHSPPARRALQPAAASERGGPLCDCEGALWAMEN
jgi:hypothetical protein